MIARTERKRMIFAVLGVLSLCLAVYVATTSGPAACVIFAVISGMSFWGGARL